MFFFNGTELETGGLASLDQDLIYLVTFLRNRFVTMPTYLERFQIGGD